MEAKVPPVSAPLCLVHNQDCRLSLNPAALEVLRSATQPVVVVAIVGLFSTGKSFLTMRMAQKCSSSPLRNAVQKQTKGIWMWCLPHPCKAGVTLVLLDTEGLGSPCDGDNRNDTWIFTLALLLSSTLVYNSMRTDSRTMLGSLRLLTDLRNYVRVRARADGADPTDEFVRVFPDFVWVVRDFRLQNKQPVSADEYLDQILHPHIRLFVQENSEVQRCLRSFFPRHKMFMLERPAADRDLAQLELLREDQLQPRFRQQEEAFCRHIWKEAPVKMLLNSSPVTGRMLACLLEAYLAAITDGSVPCVESVHTAATKAENDALVEAAADKYRRGMEQDLVLPAASLSSLMAAHQNWKKRAVTFFLSQAFDNAGQHHLALLMDKLEVAKEEFCWRNKKASEQRCQEVLKELWGDMELRVQLGDYAVPGGMCLFQKDLKHVQEEYKRRPDKGVKAEAMLEKFLRVKGLEMTEMWLDRVDQQCKAVMSGVKAATQDVGRQLKEHQQQQMVELKKMREVKEMVELRIGFLEKQQKEMLAEVAAVKKAVEKQLEEQQQQKVMLAEVSAAKKAMEKQLEEQQQQKVMLAEVTAAKKAVKKQLEEQQQQQQVALATVTAAQEAAEAQPEEQQQQQVMLAEVTVVMKVMEKLLEERWQQWAQQLQKEQSLVLSQRLEELEVRLQEDHGHEAAALQQAELMQDEEQTVPSWRSTLLKFLDKVVVPILIRVVNSMVNNAA